jgi:hypothetical protein
MDLDEHEPEALASQPTESKPTPTRVRPTPQPRQTATATITLEEAVQQVIAAAMDALRHRPRIWLMLGLLALSQTILGQTVGIPIHLHHYRYHRGGGSVTREEG